MLSENILFALNDTDDSYINTVSLILGYRHNKSSGHYTAKTARRIILVAAVIAAFLAFGAVAYAANLWGIRDLWPSSNAQHSALPDAAAELVEQHKEAVAADGWSARITETLCDDTTVIMTIAVSGGDKYLAIPTDVNPWDSAAVLGLAETGSISEYAASIGKKVLTVNVGITDEQVGIFTASLYFESVSDDEMVILYTGQKNISFSSIDTVCDIIVREEGFEDVQRFEIPFSLSQNASKNTELFLPLDPDTIPGLRINAASVTNTELGMTLELTGTPTADYKQETIMKMDCDEITEYYSGSGGLDENGVWHSSLTMCKGNITDTLTVHFYNWDKELLGEIVFKKN